MTLSRIATSPNEKHQGQTLTKEEVKVQTAMILVWKMFQKKRLNPCIRLCGIFEIFENARHFFSIGQIQDLFTFTQVRKLLRLGYVND